MTKKITIFHPELGEIEMIKETDDPETVARIEKETQDLIDESEQLNEDS